LIAVGEDVQLNWLQAVACRRLFDYPARGFGLRPVGGGVCTSSSNCFLVFFFFFGLFFCVVELWWKEFLYNYLFLALFCNTYICCLIFIDMLCGKLKSLLKIGEYQEKFAQERFHLHFLSSQNFIDFYFHICY
jgi:hypothetical protein